jgi:RNA polymerase sigma-70 factor, ECF subfamily
MFAEMVHPESAAIEGNFRPECAQFEGGLYQKQSFGEAEMISTNTFEPSGVDQANQSSEVIACLIQSALSGDLSAFNTLVEMHQDSLYGWVVSLVNDDALADDITQSVFITAYEKLSSFRGGSFRAWLFKIARNRSFDEMRWKKRHPSFSLDEDPEDDQSLHSILPDHAPLPEDALIDAEQAGQIERMINRLPEVFQQVLRLVDMEGMDYQEAADVLDLPLGTVKSRVARARIKMRRQFQQVQWF